MTDEQKKMPRPVEITDETVAEIVDDILYDLSCRKGIGDELDQIKNDLPIWEEIRQSLTERTREHLQSALTAWNKRVQPEGGEAKPVAWRWKPKDATLWVYDPEGEWLEAQGDDIDKEPLYARALSSDTGGAAATQGDYLSQAAIDVLAERARQIGAEGWTPAHDDEHECGEISRAAASYAWAGSFTGEHLSQTSLVRQMWPWSWTWWKPSDRRRDLVKAGALILAEIERLDRALPSPTISSDAEGFQQSDKDRSVLFFASYCGDDNPSECNDATPCLECLRMSNVFRIRAGAMIKYERQLDGFPPSPTISSGSAK